jgi:hypothetical protein
MSPQRWQPADPHIVVLSLHAPLQHCSPAWPHEAQVVP